MLLITPAVQSTMLDTACPARITGPLIALNFGIAPPQKIGPLSERPGWSIGPLPSLRLVDFVHRDQTEKEGTSEGADDDAEHQTGQEHQLFSFSSSLIRNSTRSARSGSTRSLLG